MAFIEQMGGIIILLLIGSYVLDRIGKIVERLIGAAERSATANELTALYTRELCWRVHDLPKTRNGKGELMRWQDPAEIYDIAWGILADADKRAAVKRRREEFNGFPDPTSHEYTDVGPEAEAAKAQSAESDARFNEMLARFKKPKHDDSDNQTPAK